MPITDKVIQGHDAGHLMLLSDSDALAISAAFDVRSDEGSWRLQQRRQLIAYQTGF